MSEIQQADGDGRPVVVFIRGLEDLGDGLLTLPAYRALRHAFPGHRFVGLNRAYSRFFAAFPGFREAIFDAYHERLKLSGVGQIRAALRPFGPVGLIVDLRSSVSSFWTLLAAGRGARRVVGNTRGYIVRKGVPRGFETRPADNAHRYHRLVEIAAGRPLPFDPALPEDSGAAAHAARLMPAGPRHVGIAPGPVNLKYWPADRLVALAADIAAMGAKPVFLVGPEEDAKHGWIAERVPDALVIDRRAVDGDLLRLPWLMHAAAGRMAACVATEAGLGHLVATRGIPLVTLAGPSDPHAWRPVTPLWWLVRAQDFGSDRMEAIPVEAVTRALADALRWEAGFRLA